MKVYELLDSPEKWCKHNLAMDIDGNVELDPCNQNACRWCLYGALYKCYPTNTDPMWDVIDNELQQPVSQWNDHPSTTYEDVISLCKRLDV